MKILTTLQVDAVYGGFKSCDPSITLSKGQACATSSHNDTIISSARTNWSGGGCKFLDVWCDGFPITGPNGGTTWCCPPGKEMLIYNNGVSVTTDSIYVAVTLVS